MTEKIYEVDLFAIKKITDKILLKNGGKPFSIKVKSHLGKHFGGDTWMLFDVKVKSNGDWTATPYDKISTVPKIGDIK